MEDRSLHARSCAFWCIHEVLTRSRTIVDFIAVLLLCLQAKVALELHG